MNFNVPSFVGGGSQPASNRGSSSSNAFPKAATKSILHQPGARTTNNIDQKKSVLLNTPGKSGTAASTTALGHLSAGRFKEETISSAIKRNLLTAKSVKF